MTREDILAMPAGRELDSLVALKVMELNVSQRNGAFAIISEFGRSGMRPYSTDISAAWEVVEELRRRYFHIEIMTDEEHWKVRTNTDEWAFSLEIAEAICKAALIAVMEVSP